MGKKEKKKTISTEKHSLNPDWKKEKRERDTHIHQCRDMCVAFFFFFFNTTPAIIHRPFLWNWNKKKKTKEKENKTQKCWERQLKEWERLGRSNQSVWFISLVGIFYQWPLAEERKNSWTVSYRNTQRPLLLFQIKSPSFETFLSLFVCSKIIVSLRARCETEKTRHKKEAVLFFGKPPQKKQKNKTRKLKRSEMWSSRVDCNKWSRHLVNNYAICRYELCLSLLPTCPARIWTKEVEKRNKWSKNKR